MAHSVITEQSGEKGEHPTGLFQGDGGVQVAVRGCEIVRGYHQECQVYREKNPDEDQVPVDFEVSVWVGREMKKQLHKFELTAEAQRSGRIRSISPTLLSVREVLKVL